MLKIGIIGECMVELFDQGDGAYQRTFGGDTLNTAVYIARSAAVDIEGHYVTLLGDDALSEAMLESWQAEGIHTDTVGQIAGAVPGLYMIQTDEGGERSFLYWRGEAPAKKLFQTANTQDLIAKILGYDWVYFTGITLAILEPAGRNALFALLDDFRSKGGRVAFDGNYRERLWQGEDAIALMSQAYRRCDLVLPSADDESLLWQDNDPASIIQRLHDFGCTEIVLKRGRETCLVSQQGELTEHAVTALDKVVDSTAAGDSFNAGYLAERMRGRSIIEAVRAGQYIARQVISQKGAIVPLSF